MFRKFFALFTRRAQEQVEFFPYIVRDATTHQIIAKGEKEKMRNFVASFGGCYLEGV